MPTPDRDAHAPAHTDADTDTEASPTDGTAPPARRRRPHLPRPAPDDGILYRRDEAPRRPARRLVPPPNPIAGDTGDPPTDDARAPDDLASTTIVADAAPPIPAADPPPGTPSPPRPDAPAGGGRSGPGRGPAPCGPRLLHLTDLRRHDLAVGDDGVTLPATLLVEDTPDGASLRPLPYCGLPVSTEQRRRNVAIIGATGSGKTYRCALAWYDAIARQTPDSILGLNVKGPRGTEELIRVVERAHAGTDVPAPHVVVFAPGDPERSVGFNLLRFARRHGMVESLVEAIVASTPKSSRDSGYWDAVALRLIRAALELPRIRSLAAAHELFQDMRTLRDVARATGDRTLLGFVEHADTGSQNAATNLTDIAARLAHFAQSDGVRAVTSGPDELDVMELLESGERFLLVIEANEATLRQERSVVNVFLSLLFESVVAVSERHDGGLPRPLGCILDEFGAIGRIAGLGTLVNTTRSRRVSIVACLQSVAQIGLHYRDEAETVLAGFNSRIVLCSGLSAMDRTVASRHAGAIETSTWTHHQQADPETGAWRTMGRSEHLHHRPLISPEDLLLEPHPLFGGFAYAFLVDLPPVIVHCTPAWELPHLQAAMDAAMETTAESRRARRAAALPAVPPMGLLAAAPDDAAGTTGPAPSPSPAPARSPSRSPSDASEDRDDAPTPTGAAADPTGADDRPAEPPDSPSSAAAAEAPPTTITPVEIPNDVHRWPAHRLRARLQTYRRALRYDAAPAAAQRWWDGVEQRVTTDVRAVLRVAEALRQRRATVTEAHHARLHARTDCIEVLVPCILYRRALDACAAADAPLPSPGDSGDGAAVGPDAPIEALGLGVRACRAFRRAGITRVADLDARRLPELAAIRGIGRTTIRRLQDRRAARRRSGGRSDSPTPPTTTEEGS